MNFRKVAAISPTTQCDRQLRLSRLTTKIEFLYLVGGRLRQLLDEAPDPRNLEGRQVLAAERLQLIRCQPGAKARLDKGSVDLAPFRIRQSDDGRIGDPGMREEHVFDLAGEDVLAAANNLAEGQSYRRVINKTPVLRNRYGEGQILLRS